MVNHSDYDGDGEEAVEINDEIIAAASYSAEDEVAIQTLPDATTDYNDDDDDDDDDEDEDDAATVDYDGNNSTVGIIPTDDDDGAAGGPRARIISKKKKKCITVALVSVAFLAMVVGLGAGFGTKAKNNNSLSSSNEAQGYEMTYAMCMKEQGLPVDGDVEPTAESPTSFPTAGSSEGTSASEALSQAGMDMDMDMYAEMAASNEDGGDDGDGEDEDEDEEDEDITPPKSNSNDNHMMITIDTTGGRLLRGELRGTGDIAAASANRRELEETCAKLKTSKGSKTPNKMDKEESIEGLQNGMWERRRVPKNGRVLVWTYGGSSKAGKQGQGTSNPNTKLHKGDWICIRKRKNGNCRNSRPKPQKGEGLEDGHWRFLPQTGQPMDSKSGKHNGGSIVWAFEKKNRVTWIWVAKRSANRLPASSVEMFGSQDPMAPAEVVDVGSEEVSRSSKEGKPTLAPSYFASTDEQSLAELDDGDFGGEESSEAAAKKALKGLQNGHWEIAKSNRATGLIWALDEEGSNGSKAGKGRKDDTPLENGKWVCLARPGKNCRKPNKDTLEVGEWRKAKVIRGKEKITIWVLDGKNKVQIFGWVYENKKAMDGLTGFNEEDDTDFFQLQEGENLIIGSDEVIFEVEGDEEETDLYVGLNYTTTNDSTSGGEVV